MGASKQENSTEIGRSHWYSYISSMPSHPEHDRIRCNRQWQDCEDLDSGKMRIFFPPLAAEGNVLLDGWSFCIFPDPYPIDMLVVLIHLTTVHVLRVFDGTQLSKLFIYVIIVNSLDVITGEFQLWDISPQQVKLRSADPGLSQAGSVLMVRVGWLRCWVVIISFMWSQQQMRYVPITLWTSELLDTLMLNILLLWKRVFYIIWGADRIPSLRSC